MERIAPDRCVILGDDQHEAFLDDNLPSICVYAGDTVDDVPEEGRTPDPNRDYLYNAPAVRTTHPTDAAFGNHLIASLVKSGFEVARSNALPAGRRGGGAIGHAFHFAYRRLMNNEAIPHVPIFLNTYYPPNQPTVERCYQFGQAVRTAIESWDSNQRVALIASGGLSHFVVEEELDQHILDGLVNADRKKLTDLPDIRFNSGTSEIRNWIAVAGAMAGTGMDSMKLLEYQPCYRTEAGTGCGGAYGYWM